MNDLPRAFAEFRRVLKVGGLLSFTTFGPDTLREMRAAFAGIDGSTHTNRFVDMHDIGDMLGARRICRSGDGHGAHHADVRDAERVARRVEGDRRHEPDARPAARLDGPRRWSRAMRRLEALRNGWPHSGDVRGRLWSRVERRSRGTTAEGHAIVRLQRPRAG